MLCLGGVGAEPLPSNRAAMVGRAKTRGGAQSSDPASLDVRKLCLMSLPGPILPALGKQLWHLCRDSPIRRDL